MTTLLLPELAKEMAGSNRRVADSLAAESRELDTLRMKAEQLDVLKRRSARSARSAIAAALSRQAEALDVWRTAQDILEEGANEMQSAALFQHVRDIVESWLRLAQLGRDLARIAGMLGNPPEGLDQLAAAEADVRHVLAAIERVSAFLSRPRIAPDPARLAAAREEIVQGRFRTAEQIRSADRQSAEARQ